MVTVCVCVCVCARPSWPLQPLLDANIDQDNAWVGAVAKERQREASTPTDSRRWGWGRSGVLASWRRGRDADDDAIVVFEASPRTSLSPSAAPRVSGVPGILGSRCGGVDLG